MSQVEDDIMLAFYEKLDQEEVVPPELASALRNSLESNSKIKPDAVISLIRKHATPEQL